MNKPTLPASLYDATHRCYGDAYSALQMEAYAKEWLEYAAEACDLWNTSNGTVLAREIRSLK